MKQSILARLSEIEKYVDTGDTIVLVRMQGGGEKEVTIDEYEKHATEWDFKKCISMKCVKGNYPDLGRVLNCMTQFPPFHSYEEWAKWLGKT
jgi:hypothetical protein